MVEGRGTCSEGGLKELVEPTCGEKREFCTLDGLFWMVLQNDFEENRMMR